MNPALAVALRATSGIAAMALLAACGWYGYDVLARKPIANVRFTGDTSRVPAAELDRLAAGLRGRQARDVALPEVREAVKRVAWVRDCAVRRRFSDSLEIAVEAHALLARWDETRLVSVRGEVFTAEHDGALPLFSGPEGTAAEITSAWKGIERAAAPLGNPITELRLTQRRAWQATLASGLAIELGRGEFKARLVRFAAAWPHIAAEAASATHADLRYPNGFALRGLATEPKKPAPKVRRT
jgi:cell division protein FtsQ